jgi:hypothetical protein
VLVVPLSHNEPPHTIRFLFLEIPMHKPLLALRLQFEFAVGLLEHPPKLLHQELEVLLFQPKLPYLPRNLQCRISKQDQSRLLQILLRYQRNLGQKPLEVMSLGSLLSEETLICFPVIFLTSQQPYFIEGLLTRRPSSSFSCISSGFK